MKKPILLSIFALAGIFTGMNTQAQSKTGATTTVNIQLVDVISIDAPSNAVNGEVNFLYSTAASYNTTQHWSVPTSLIVTSTKSFDVKVKANGADFINGSHKIPVDVLNVKPVKGGTTTMNGSFRPITLSTSDQNIVSGASRGSKVALELDYEITAATSSSSAILGKPAGTYTQTVTYTATAL